MSSGSGRSTFQSTHPYGMRPSRRVTGSIEPANFNPRIPTGCDSFIHQRQIDLVISIHASLRDATAVFFNKEPSPLISIHASLRDATFDRLFELLQRASISIHASLRDATLGINPIQLMFEFQSTHPYGMRPSYKSLNTIAFDRISIHASLRDATRY